MFRPADLKILIGASNESPVGKYGSGDGITGKKTGELRAFYDRFLSRLYFPTPQELHPTDERKIREGYIQIMKISRDRVMERLTMESPKYFEQIACINDILLLGRLLGKIEIPEEISDLMYSIVSGLSIRRQVRELCHMSPRRANKLLPLILADTFLLPSEKLQQGPTGVTEILKYVEKDSSLRVAQCNLRVFHHIWDYEGDRTRLQEEVDILLDVI